MPDTPSPADGASTEAGFGALIRVRLAARRGLRGVLAAQTVRTVLRLGFSAAAAMAIGRLIMQQPVGPTLLSAAASLLILTIVAGFIADRLQAGGERQVSSTLRSAAVDVLRTMPARRLQSLPAGALAVGMQRHPDALAALAIGHSAATAMMAIGPLAAAATLWIVSWQAALLMIVLTPVMIVFFALVGETIRRRADEQERAFGRLAGQFADRIRTLPTILANQALGREEDKLAARLEAYAANTMRVLRIAFVNAAIIDFFASLSIAMLAVFLGLGHLKLVMLPGFSNLELWQSLFILMIAPEYFAPFRRFSEQYHAKAEGVAAAAGLDRLLSAADGPAPMLGQPEGTIGALPEHGLVAIAGPSGSGKSTLLRRIAGIERGHGSGVLSGARISWISTDSPVAEGTLATAIAAGRTIPETQIEAAAADVGLLDDALLAGGLDAPVRHGGANLSGGQRLRVAVARALLSDRSVLADEPTAKLDAENAERVRRALLSIAHSRLVVVATHDTELIRLADRVISLTGCGRLETAA